MPSLELVDGRPSVVSTGTTSTDRTSHLQPRRASSSTAARKNPASVGMHAEVGPIESPTLHQTRIRPKTTSKMPTTTSVPSSSTQAMPPSHPPVSDSKRRSMIRSAGTASSPDLAELSRVSKDAYGDGAGTTSKANDRTTEEASSRSSDIREPSDTPTSRMVTTSKPPTPPPTGQWTSTQRDRAASHSNPGRPLPTSVSQPQGISADGGRATAGSLTMGRKATPPQKVEDPAGYKTMRSRARGMFGRMFGSGSKDPPVSAGIQHLTSTISNNLSNSSTSRLGTLPSSAPPLLTSHQRRSSTDTRNRSVTPTQGVVSNPTRRASNERQSLERFEKPLPPVARSSSSSGRPQSTDADTLRAAKTHHTRQPAASGEEETLTTPSKPSHDLADNLARSNTHFDSPSPGKQIRQWKRDVEGMLEGDGVEANLAQELGLPPDSVSSSPRGKKRSPVPAFEGTTTTRKAPDYGLLNSASSSTKSIPKYAARTTSLPTEHRTLSQTNGRTMSSPVGSHAEETPLSGVELAPPAATTHVTTSGEPLKICDPDDVTITAIDPIDAPEEVTSHESDFGARRGSASDMIGGTARLVSVPTPQDSPIRWRLQSASDVKLPDTVSVSQLGRSAAWGAMASSDRRDPPTPTRQTSDVVIVDEPEGMSADDDALDEEGRKMACEFLEDDGTHVTHDRVAEYLGGIRPLSKYALKHYMAYFDFAGMRVDEAFRQFCQKLYLKAETQEIDRILGGFSARYFQCNPTTIFGSPTVTHVVTGSFLLLNTDLHIADITQHMSRNQFVKLTLDTIYANVQPPSERSSTPELTRDDSSSTTQIASLSTNGQVPPPSSVSRSVSPRGPRTDSVYSTLSRKDSLHTPNMTATYLSSATTPGQEPKSRLGSSTSVGSSLFNKGWEAEVEVALKDIFAAVKSQQILLPVNNPVQLGSPYSPLSTMQANRRKASQRNSSNGSTDRVYSLKRGSVRGVQGLLGASPYGASHLSVDGHVSPTASYATSIGEGFLSPPHLAGPSLGFASNLSHTVIKEHEDENSSTVSGMSDSTSEDLTDDQLALFGPPWAKEGNLSRKPYWDAPNKRSKEKTWKQAFVVIQKEDLHMFTFGEGSSRSTSGAAVGGGNWMTNARGRGEMNLSHALASALPPPGYNTSRPYCFSLTLPGGEMSFFQAGTEDLVQEWVATCNYWAARRSRPPLPGGLGNVEYGWNRLLDAVAGSSSATPDDTMSMRSNRSGRSRMSFHGTMGRRNGNAAVIERMHIAEWRAPQSSLIPSPLDEETQLESLQKHVQSLKKQLEEHKMLEEPMSRMYSARTSNGTKAMENWRNKSLFIHSEIVKYSTYMDALKSAISLRLKKQGEKKLERSLHRHVEVDEEDDCIASIRQKQLSITPTP